MDFYVDEKSEGKTVLWVVKNHLKLSSAHLKHLKFIENGIRVNGEHATVRKVLCSGDILSLATEDEGDCSDSSVTPVELGLNIVYEDEDCIIPSKPADMPTHPSHDHYTDTVANALAFIFKERGVPFVFRPVNRLDRNTSGLLVIAKNRIAAGVLSSSMKAGNIRKIYVAILEGAIPTPCGVVESYMKRTAESIIVRKNCGAEEGGDYALTEYATVLEANGYSVVVASPITGRTHQLRVHFAGLGAPILGDDMYGNPSPIIERHALHSALLCFPRVSDGNTVTVRSKLPEDMERAAKELFGDLLTEELIASACELLLNNEKTSKQRITLSNG